VRWSRSNSRYSFIIQNKRAISTWEINDTKQKSNINMRNQCNSVLKRNQHQKMNNWNWGL